MLITVEGTYKKGRIELDEVPKDVQVGRVLVTFIPNGSAENAPAVQGQRMEIGVFAGPIKTNEEDFQLAEFHGDPAW